MKKSLLHEAPTKEEPFEFRLSPTKQVVSIQGAGKTSFEPVIFTKAGTYTYTITERNKGTLGYTYDSSVYTWTVVVEEKDHQLVIASEVLKKDNDAYEQETVVFENQYDHSKIIEEKWRILRRGR